jgi:transposase
MWKTYLKVVRERCSAALHFLDRFHIVAKMNKALDEVRTGEARRMAHDGLALVLRKPRWLLLKWEENRQDEQRFRLRSAPLQPPVRPASLLKEAFQPLWDYNSPAWAGKFLDEWCRQVEGLNNKTKVTMRKSYGFRTFRTLELASITHLASCQSPESTHESF